MINEYVVNMKEWMFIKLAYILTSVIAKVANGNTWVDLQSVGSMCVFQLILE